MKTDASAYVAKMNQWAREYSYYLEAGEAGVASRFYRRLCELALEALVKEIPVAFDGYREDHCRARKLFSVMKFKENKND